MPRAKKPARAADEEHPPARPRRRLTAEERERILADPDASPGKKKLARAGIPAGNPGHSGGKKGRSGRPSFAVKRFYARQLERPEVQRAVARLMANEKAKGFVAMHKVALAYTEGLPVQKVEAKLEATVLVSVDL